MGGGQRGLEAVLWLNERGASCCQRSVLLGSKTGRSAYVCVGSDAAGSSSGAAAASVRLSVCCARSPRPSATRVLVLAVRPHLSPACVSNPLPAMLYLTYKGAALLAASLAGSFPPLAALVPQLPALTQTA